MTSLVCPIAFCQVKSVNEPKVCCYGPCQVNFHAICLGIPEVCIDRFRDPLADFKYVCFNCRDVSIASISTEFKRLETNFTALKTKLLSFEKSSPEVIDILDSGNSSPPVISVKRTAKEVDELTVPVPNKVLTRSAAAKVRDVAKKNKKITVDPSSPPTLGLSAATSVSNNAAPPQLLVTVPSPSPTAVNLTSDVELTVVPKPISVFVSRLSPSTSIQQVTSHIGARLGNCDTVKVKKLTNDRRAVASFRIDGGRDMLNNLLQKEFWPEGAYVNIFEERGNNKAKRRLNNLKTTNPRIRETITSSNASNPKN